MNTDEQPMSFAEHEPVANGWHPHTPILEQPLGMAVLAEPEQPTSLETAPAAEVQTDSLLADLDQATQSLVSFRQEIGRLVNAQRSTAAELEAMRSRVFVLESEARECTDCRRLEGQLAQQREQFANARMKLAEVVASLEPR